MLVKRSSELPFVSIYYLWGAGSSHVDHFWGRLSTVMLTYFRFHEDFTNVTPQTTPNQQVAISLVSCSNARFTALRDPFPSKSQIASVNMKFSILTLATALTSASAFTAVSQHVMNFERLILFLTRNLIYFAQTTAKECSLVDFFEGLGRQGLLDCSFDPFR